MSNTERPQLSLQQVQEILRRDKERKARELEEVREAVAASDVPLPAMLLQKILGLFHRDAESVMRSHAGFALFERRAHYRASLSIMYQSLDDLDAALTEFEALAKTENAEILRYHNRERLQEIESRIQKEMFATANAAASLVDHVRRLQSRVLIPAFAERLRSSFGDSGLHDLIIGLRVLLHHLHIVRAGWNISTDYAAGTRTAGFSIDRAELERALDAAGDRFQGNQGEPIRRCIGSLPEKIDLRDLFESYRTCLDEFYGWFDVQIQTQAPPALLDYDRCMLEKKRSDTRMMWNALIGNWLQWRAVPDVHSRLPDYVTEEQLRAVNELPRNSREQVDLIVRFIDEDGAADDSIRAKIYQLFERLAEQEGQGK